METLKFASDATVQPSAMARAMKRMGSQMEIDTSNQLALSQITSRGLEVDKIDCLRGVVKQAKDLSWIIKSRTLAYRKQNQQRLTAQESERLIRAAKVLFLACAVFGNVEKAERWLYKANPNYDGLTPMKLVQTEEGAALVLDTLNQIDCGFNL